MSPAAKHNLFLRVDLDSPLPPNDVNSVKAAVDKTTQELTIFLALKQPSLLSAEAGGSTGWSNMQRRVAELYVISATRTLENKSEVSVDVVPVDFCAYSVEHMEPYRNSVTLVSSEGDAVFPAWWPADNEVELAVDPSPAPIRKATDPQQTSQHAIPWNAYQHVAVGGTFDHLHIGHKILLTATALAATTRLTCGISADALLANKKYKEFLESYRDREINVLLFLRKIRKDIIFQLVAIVDRYGPTAIDPSIGALVVSHETMNGCEDLNAVREEKGFAPMHIMAIDLITLSDAPANGSTEHCISSENTALKLSSTVIRAALAERQNASTSTLTSTSL